YTFSKVMCWVALDKLLSLDNRGTIQAGARTTVFRHARDEIAQCIETQGFNSELNSYTGELDGKDVDAALLLMAFSGYKDARHPRMISTYERIQNELGRNRLLYRYKPGYDGLKRDQGTFGMCSFLAVE